MNNVKTVKVTLNRDISTDNPVKLDIDNLTFTETNKGDVSVDFAMEDGRVIKGVSNE